MSVHDRQTAEVGHCSRFNQEHPAGIVAADRQQVCSWPGDCRGGHVRQFELAGGQRNRLRRGKDARLEGDRVGTWEDIGQIDRLAETELAEVRSPAIGGRVHDQRNTGLEGTDVHCTGAAQSPLVRGGDACAASSGIDRRTSGQQGHRLRRAAVVAQRGQTRIYHPDDVAVRAVDQSARAAGTDQIMRP